MLVLSRKIGERILVPDCELAVTVIGVLGNTVRLGICAPPKISVYREEILPQPDRANADLVKQNKRRGGANQLDGVRQ